MDGPGPVQSGDCTVRSHREAVCLLTHTDFPDAGAQRHDRFKVTQTQRCLCGSWTWSA